MIVIDRIEGTVAVAEMDDGSFQDIPLERIAGHVRDGALLREAEDGSYAVDEEATARRTDEIRSRFGSLFR